LNPANLEKRRMEGRRKPVTMVPLRKVKGGPPIPFRIQDRGPEIGKQGENFVPQFLEGRDKSMKGTDGVLCPHRTGEVRLDAGLLGQVRETKKCENICNTTQKGNA